MEISDKLRCLFSARLEERNGSYVVDIPDQELTLGDIHARGTYRVAILSTATETEASSDESDRDAGHERGLPEPPVTEGERRAVDIEDIGKQGDGIARVERGFVVIVPDTEQGEQVTIEITDVRDNVAFGEVVEKPTRA